MHIVCILSSVTARSRISWCSQPGDGLPLASDAFAESLRTRADLNTRIRIAHRSRSLGCGTQARDGPPSSIHALTSRDVALCVTRTGVGLALTDHSITELARQRAKPNVRQHPRRVLARCAAHGRASPSTLPRGTQQTGSPAGCIPRLPNAERSPSVCAVRSRASPSTFFRETGQAGWKAACIPRLRNAEQRLRNAERSPPFRNDRTC
jgi:hypothetical protein